MGIEQPAGMWLLDRVDGHSFDPSNPNESFYEMGGEYINGKVMESSGAFDGSFEG